MGSKYRNVKTVIDNITFDSRAEARRYAELKLLMDAEIIDNLQVHPRYLIDDPFTQDGKRYGAVYYIPDFVYCERGSTVAEDVKGVRTAVYVLKKRLFIKRYPQIKFMEIEA